MINPLKDPLIDWLMSDDTGISSKAIVAHLTGKTTPSGFGDWPRDADDLGRCYRLLVRVPSFAPRIKELSSRSPQWAALIEHWDELIGMVITSNDHLSRRMRKILAGVPNKNEVRLGPNMSITFASKEK